MKVLNFKDIRFFEIKPENYIGNFDGILGNVYNDTIDSKNIGIRIAKKLNEHHFTFGDFDHLYVFLNPKISENKIVETEIYDLGWNKDIFYGLDNVKFNNLNETQRNLKLEEIAFEILRNLVKNDIEELNIINLVQTEILVNQTNTEILLKEKIFKNISINLSFKINPNGKKSVMIIRGSNNGDIICTKIIELFHHEDVYYIVDKIKYDGNKIIIDSKKNIKSEVVTGKYESPIIVDCNCL